MSTSSSNSKTIKKLNEKYDKFAALEDAIKQKRLEDLKAEQKLLELKIKEQKLKRKINGPRGKEKAGEGGSGPGRIRSDSTLSSP
jgi:septal ring factor EnvC (AmiA/AmiB activator)